MEAYGGPTKYRNIVFEFTRLCTSYTCGRKAAAASTAITLCRRQGRHGPTQLLLKRTTERHQHEDFRPSRNYTLTAALTRTIPLHLGPRALAAGVSSGTCTPPKAQYSAQAGPKPGQQEPERRLCVAIPAECTLGRCLGVSGSRAPLNRAQTGIEKNMHGDTTLGYEVVPVNVEYTAQQLNLPTTCGTHAAGASGGGINSGCRSGHGPLHRVVPNLG